jgi:two-component system nitrate/nitrite response regulator NarL
MLKILLVDDHILFRKGLVSLLNSLEGIRVIGEANNGLEAFEAAKILQPDLILMDINMPKCDGLEATKKIKAFFPWVKVVMLTASEDDEYLFEAMKIGASGYLLKDLEVHQLVDLFDTIRKGEAILSSTMATKIFKEFRQEGGKEGKGEPLHEELTRREKTILNYVAKGLMNNEIAETLSISENTVKIHLRNILDKLHLKNRIQAAVYAVKHGLTEDEDKGDEE